MPSGPPGSSGGGSTRARRPASAGAGVAVRRVRRGVRDGSGDDRPAVANPGKPVACERSSGVVSTRCDPHVATLFYDGRQLVEVLLAYETCSDQVDGNTVDRNPLTPRVRLPPNTCIRIACQGCGQQLSLATHSGRLDRPLNPPCRFRIGTCSSTHLENGRIRDSFTPSATRQGSVSRNSCPELVCHEPPCR